jgi:hypothetical protein
VTHTFNGPLLRDRIAEEDEKEVEDEGPDNDDAAHAIHPAPELEGEHTHVEGKLAHLEGCETPNVDQREGEGDLHDDR